MRNTKLRLPVIIISILIFLTCCAFVITLIQHRSPPHPKEQQKEPFVADQELIIPDGPVIQKEQYPSRVTPEKWSEDDLQQWFTKPEGMAMQNLKDSNDAIVSTITGAAP
jgi:hypothetical protein